MKEDRTTPLRKRMIEDMRIRDIKETTQKGHIRAIKNLPHFWDARRTLRPQTSCVPISCT